MCSHVCLAIGVYRTSLCTTKMGPTQTDKAIGLLDLALPSFLLSSTAFSCPSSLFLFSDFKIHSGCIAQAGLELSVYPRQASCVGLLIQLSSNSYISTTISFPCSLSGCPRTEIAHPRDVGRGHRCRDTHTYKLQGVCQGSES